MKIDHNPNLLATLYYVNKLQLWCKVRFCTKLFELALTVVIVVGYDRYTASVYLRSRDELRRARMRRRTASGRGARVTALTNRLWLPLSPPPPPPLQTSRFARPALIVRHCHALSNNDLNPFNYPFNWTLLPDQNSIINY